MSMKSFTFFDREPIVPLKTIKDGPQQIIRKLFAPRTQKDLDVKIQITDFDYDCPYLTFGDSQGYIHTFHKESYQGCVSLNGFLDDGPAQSPSQSVERQFSQKVSAVKFLYKQKTETTDFFILSIGTDVDKIPQAPTPQVPHPPPIEKKKTFLRVFLCKNTKKEKQNSGQPSKQTLAYEKLSETWLADDDLEIVSVASSIQSELVAISTINSQRTGNVTFFKRELASGNKWQFKQIQSLNSGYATNLAFSKELSADKTSTNFFLTSTDGHAKITRYSLQTNLAKIQPKQAQDLDTTRVCQIRCASVNSLEEFVIADKSGILKYENKPGGSSKADKSTPLLPQTFQEDPIACAAVGTYYVLVAKNEADPDAVSIKQNVIVYQFNDQVKSSGPDKPEPYKAFEKSFPTEVLKIVEDRSNNNSGRGTARFFILGREMDSGDYSVAEYEEKSVQERREILTKKYEYVLAKSVDNGKGDQDSELETTQKFANFLFSKGKYAEAVKQFIASIKLGLEPSHVIRKFLDSQRNENLIDYLIALHENTDGPIQATAEHTVLLLNCFSRLQVTSPFQKSAEKKSSMVQNASSSAPAAAGSSEDPNKASASSGGAPEEPTKLDEAKKISKTHEREEYVKSKMRAFLYKNKKPVFNVKTAIRMLRSQGYSDLALEVAEKFQKDEKLDKFIIQIQLEDFDERYTPFYQDYAIRALQHLETLDFTKAERYMKAFAKDFIRKIPQYAINVLIRLCTKWVETPKEKEDRTIKPTGVSSLNDNNSGGNSGGKDANKKGAAGSSLFFGVDTDEKKAKPENEEEQNGDEEDNEDEDQELDEDDEDYEERTSKKQKKEKKSHGPQAAQAEEFIFAFADQKYWLMVFLENVIERIRANQLSRVLPHQNCYNSLLELYLKYYETLKDCEINSQDYYDFFFFCEPKAIVVGISGDTKRIPDTYQFQRPSIIAAASAQKDSEKLLFNYKTHAPDQTFFTTKFSKKIMHVLEMSRHVDQVLYDDEHALAMVEAKQFEEATLYLYEKLGLYYDILQHFMEKTEKIKLGTYSHKATTASTSSASSSSSESENESENENESDSDEEEASNNKLHVGEQDKKKQEEEKVEQLKLEQLSAFYNEIINRCVKYGEKDANMWILVVSFFSNKIGSCAVKPKGDKSTSSSSTSTDTDTTSTSDTDSENEDENTDNSDKKDKKKQKKQFKLERKQIMLQKHKLLLEEKVSRILEHISKSNILSPLLVVQILSEQSNTEISIVKDFLISKLDAEQKEIENYSQDILSLQKDTKKLHEEIDELRTSAKIFQLSSCVACSEQLDLPAIHFMCGHSYHQRCLDDVEECPKCGKKNRQAVREAKKILEEEVNEPFFKQMKSAANNPEKAFETIATWFGRMKFSPTLEENPEEN